MVPGDRRVGVGVQRLRRGDLDAVVSLHCLCILSRGSAPYLLTAEGRARGANPAGFRLIMPVSAPRQAPGVASGVKGGEEDGRHRGLSVPRSCWARAEVSGVKWPGWCPGRRKLLLLSLHFFSVSSLLCLTVASLPRPWLFPELPRLAQHLA